MKTIKQFLRVASLTVIALGASQVWAKDKLTIGLIPPKIPKR